MIASLPWILLITGRYADPGPFFLLGSILAGVAILAGGFGMVSAKRTSADHEALLPALALLSLHLGFWIFSTGIYFYFPNSVLPLLLVYLNLALLFGSWIAVIIGIRAVG